MRKLALELRAAFEATEGIIHGPTKGTSRERAVSRVLAPYVPGRYELGSGIVVNSSGDASEQQDVLIVDPSVGSPFVSEGDLGVYPVEAIAGSIQVKSRVDGGDVRAAVANLESFIRLVPKAPRTYTGFNEHRRFVVVERVMRPFTGIIALDAGASATALRRAYITANIAVPPLHRSSAFLVLDDFCVLWAPDADPAEPSVTDDPHIARGARTFAAERDSALFFYIALIGGLNRYECPRLDLLEYVNASGLSWTQYLDTWRGPEDEQASDEPSRT